MKKLICIVVILISVLIVGCGEVAKETSSDSDERVSVPVVGYTTKSTICDGLGVTKSYTINSFNIDNFLIKIQFYNTSSVLQRQVNYTKNKYNDVIGFQEYAGGVLDSYMTSVQDSDFRVIKRDSYDSLGSLTHYRENEYYGSTRYYSLEVSYDSLGVTTSQRIVLFNANSLPMQLNSYDGVGTFLGYHMITYDENNNEILCGLYNSLDVLQIYDVRAFDGLNRRISETRFSSSGVTQDYSICYYNESEIFPWKYEEYDSLNNLIEYQINEKI